MLMTGKHSKNVSNRSECLFGGNYLDFDENLLGKFLDGDSRAGRVGLSELAAIHLVHFAKEAHIGEEYGGLEYIVKSHAGLGEDSLDIGD